MISVPSIGHRLPGIFWNATPQVKDSDAKVSLLQYLFSGERSTVCRGELSCFCVITIR